MNVYPYEITYKLPHAPNRRKTKRVVATHMAEAKREFESDMPSAVIVHARPLPSNA